jgi:transposase
MKEQVNITTERVDDIPLLLAHMPRMGLTALLDKHFPTHGNWQGLSLGGVTTVWLAHVLSEGDHRMNHVQAWTERRVETLGNGLGERVTGRDLNDDRLAEVLHELSDDERWRAFEHELSGQLLRVYDLEVHCVRLDSTTASSYASVTEEGLLQFGHSKDHRPDLPQLKVMLASLDPLGMPLAREVLSGEHADDPWYLPVIARVQACLGQHGLLYVGDCKMGALQTRARVQASQDSYLCPLSALVMPPQQVAQALACAQAAGELLHAVERQEADGSRERIAEGYEQEVELSAAVDGQTVNWTERRFLVRSLALAKASEQALRSRLIRAQSALAQLLVPRRGKPPLRERADVEQAIVELLTDARVEGLLEVTVNESVTEQPVRAYRNRPASVRLVREFTLSCQVNQLALEQALAQLGWRVYATNHDAAHLTLTQAVLAYRDEYLVEGNFGRLKGHPLSLAPMYVERDDHATGLVRLLTIALRVLTLLEFVVRRQLAESGSVLAGLYAGNPKRATAQPTAERLLEAFDEITLTLVGNPSPLLRHLTPLSPLQLRILALLDFTPSLYTNLCGDSSEPP